MYCVVGLGNPGSQYTETRHNLGFRVADALAARSDMRIRRSEFRALTATVRIGRSEVLLLKPQTFMNLSGEAVAAAIRRFDVPLERVVVVYDDADLPLGKIRLRKGGGGGGHRGVESIIAEVAGRDFVRVKLGVGRPDDGADLAEFLLRGFEPSEHTTAEALVTAGADAVAAVVARGVTAAMQTFNGSCVRVDGEDR